MAEAREVVAKATEAFNAHDEERFRALYAENAVMEAPDVHLEGVDSIIGYAMSWLRAFPDARVTVHNEIVAGNWVAHEFTFEGTHKEALAGPAGEIAPTNRRLVGRGAETFRVEDGKIVQDHLYFDQVQVMTQLGLMPESAAV